MRYPDAQDTTTAFNDYRISIGNRVLSRIFLGLLVLFRVALATAIVIVVAEELHRITVYSFDGQVVTAYPSACLMGGQLSDGDVCAYTFAVCGLSLAILLFSSPFLCIASDVCGLSPSMKLIVEAFQTTWWVIASIVVSNAVSAANDAALPDGSRVPKAPWRNAVAVMAWVTAALSGAAVALLLGECAKNSAECCGIFSRKNGKAHDFECEAPSQTEQQSQQRQPQGNYAASAAATVEMPSPGHAYTPPPEAPDEDAGAVAATAV